MQNGQSSLSEILKRIDNRRSQILRRELSSSNESVIVTFADGTQAEISLETEEELAEWLEARRKFQAGRLTAEPADCWTVCPNCSAVWTLDEIDEQACAACGYPDDKDINDEPRTIEDDQEEEEDEELDFSEEEDLIEDSPSLDDSEREREVGLSVTDEEE